MKKKILALILARKNSKRLKNKNIKKLHGKPLIRWTFDLLKKKILMFFSLIFLYLQTPQLLEKFQKIINFYLRG